MVIKIKTIILMTSLILFTIGCVFITVFINHNMKKQALKEAESKAHILLNRNLATHHYFSYMLKPELVKIADTFKSKDYFNPVFMSSTYAIRFIDGYFKKLLRFTNYYYKECAINARSPENEADEYEKSFLQELNQKPHLTNRSEVRTIDNKIYFNVLRKGETMEFSCLRCHSDPEIAPKDLINIYGRERSFQRKEGEILSAISIRIPLATAYSNANKMSWYLSITLLIFLLIVIGTNYFINTFLIINPINKLQQATIQISKDKNYLGQVLPLPSYGQEIIDLTSSFNQMADFLNSYHNSIEELVDKRTNDLLITNQQLQIEVSEHKKTEQALQKSNKAKELLLNEIHHRVKNNMQTVVSMIRLQCHNIEDKKILDILKITENRMKSIANIHEKLYQSNDFANINFKEYLNNLIANLFGSYEVAPNTITLKTDIENVSLRLDKALPLGLLLNELITNTFKYAFPEDKTGELAISLKHINNVFELIVSDNGIGLPEDFDLNTINSLGLHLVHAWVTQIGGKMEIKRSERTQFIIQF